MNKFQIEDAVIAPQDDDGQVYIVVELDDDPEWVTLLTEAEAFMSPDDRTCGYIQSKVSDLEKTR